MRKSVSLFTIVTYLFPLVHHIVFMNEYLNTCLKGGLSLQNKIFYIFILYFIATQYVSKYALMKDIYN